MDCSDPANIKAMSEAVFGVGRKTRVLLASCGCIDGVNFGPLYQCFIQWAEVIGFVTKSCLHIIDRASIPYGVCHYEFNRNIGMNIKLLKWADIMVIAPLSAHTLAKIAGGICDDLLTNIVRGWDPSKPFFVAPSMDQLTWNSPFSKRHWKYIDNKLGITVIPPYNSGAMPEPSEISYTVRISNETIWKD